MTASWACCRSDGEWRRHRMTSHGSGLNRLSKCGRRPWLRRSPGLGLLAVDHRRARCRDDRRCRWVAMGAPDGVRGKQLGVDVRAGFATRRELRPLLVRRPVSGRLMIGHWGRWLVATENRQAPADHSWHNPDGSHSHTGPTASVSCIKAVADDVQRVHRRCTSPDPWKAGPDG